MNGVLVHRFDVTVRPGAALLPLLGEALSAPAAATRAEARAFVETQGPGCAGARSKHSRSCDRDLIAFYPYLYTPTVDGVAAVGERAVMHPAAHDEPALHLPVFRRTMAGVQGLAFHTRGERDLVQRLFPVAELPQESFGLGFDEPDPSTWGRGPLLESLLGIGDRPYVLCLGRVDGLKGTTALAALFGAYKETKPGTRRRSPSSGRSPLSRRCPVTWS